MGLRDLSGRKARIDSVVPVGKEVKAALVINLAKSNGPYTVRVEPASAAYEVYDRGKYHKSLSQEANVSGWHFVRDILLAIGAAVGGSARSNEDFE